MAVQDYLDGRRTMDDVLGEPPGETALREVREITRLELLYKRAAWEAEFFKYVQDYFEPWQRKLLLALRNVSYKYETGDWPMTDLPDGSEC